MPKIILHVDDEPDVLALVKVVLEREGYQVTSAESGKDCLDVLKKQKVDLILLDIMMPKMSGWEVLKRVRKEYSGTKVVFLTVVKINEKMLADLIKDGLTDYIQKPCSNVDMVARVKKALGDA